MDWDNLRYFLELARAGTLVGAARRLGVDHTTVARRIQALEKQVGSPLFAREAAGHRLSEAGRSLLPQVEGMEAAFLAVEHAAPGVRQGLHGAVRTDTVDVARHVDLRIGVVPIINLEWIQKLHRDKNLRGYSQDAVVDTILRRMPDYVNYICPQFSHTHINFQRVPMVDTSNPFIAKDIPTVDESMVVIRFAKPQGIDFLYLLSMLHDSYMSRPNIIVVPGGKMSLAMQLILTPMILQLMDRKRRAG